MNVIAIDAGSIHSAYVVWDSKAGMVRQHGKIRNLELLLWLRGASLTGNVVVIEATKPRGMPASLDLMEMIWWCGRFHEATHQSGLPVHRVQRMDVKQSICGSARATDANVRAAIIDRFGGKDVAIGRKAHPGPLYGVHADEWAALGVALTYMQDGPWAGGTQ